MEDSQTRPNEMTGLSRKIQIEKKILIPETQSVSQSNLINLLLILVVLLMTIFSLVEWIQFSKIVGIYRAWIFNEYCLP